jgi:hypothetical protein
MNTLKFKFILMLVISAVVVSCGKKDESWYNNPTKISFAKPGESLTDLSKRIIDQPATSLGLALSPDRAAYQSGPIWVEADFGKDGQPIFHVRQRCEGEKLIPLGELFGDLDCKKGTAALLSAMAKDQASSVKEACVNKESDPSQVAIGYLNSQKNIYWMTAGEGGEVSTVGISKFLGAVGSEDGFGACDLSARAEYQKAEEKRVADERKWFVEDAYGGISLNKCREDEGPSEFINLLQQTKTEYGTKDEILEGGTIVQTTIQIYSRGIETTFFRGKTRCENALAERTESQKNEMNKYK